MAIPSVGFATLQIIPSMRGMEGLLQREVDQTVGKPKVTPDFDDTKVRDGLKRTEKSTEDTMKRVSAIGVAASAVIGAAFSKVLVDSTKSAADLEQAVGGTAAVFKRQSDQVSAFAQSAAEQVGLSEQSARELTSRIGGALKGYGYSLDEAAEKSITLTKLGADLAATYGGPTSDAVEALSAALRGEFDPLERYAIAINQTLIDQKAVAMGLASSTANVDQHARAQAALALIMERSADAQGQFAREADTAAGAAEIAKAKSANAAADLGKNFLPIYTKISEVTGFAADGFSRFGGSTQTAVLGITAVAGLAPGVKSLVDHARDLGGAGAANLKAFGAAGLGVTAVSLAFDLANQKLAEAEQRAKDLSQTVLASTKGSTYDELVAKFKAINTQINDLSTDVRNSSAPWDIDYRHDISVLGYQLQMTNEDIARMIGQIDSLAASTGRNKDEVAAWVTEQASLGIKFKSADEAMKAYTGSSQQAKSAAEDNAAAAKRQADALSALKSRMDAVYGAQQSLLGSSLSVDQANLDVQKAQRDLNDAQKAQLEYRPDPGATPQEIQAARMDRANAVEAARLNLANAIDRQAQATANLAQTNAELAGKTFSADEHAKAYRDTLDQLIAQHPAIAGMLSDIKARVDAIPDEKTIRIRIQAESTLANAANMLAGGAVTAMNAPATALELARRLGLGPLPSEQYAYNRLYQMALQAGAKPGAYTIPQLAHVLGLPGFAAGGWVPGGADQPQLIMAHGGEYVLNRYDAAALMGSAPGGQGGFSIGAINITGSADPERSAFAMRRELRKAAFFASGSAA